MDAARLTERSFAPAHCRRLVVKIGSSLLVEESGAIRRDRLVGLVAEIAARHAAGQRIILVSSGAIALGARLLGLGHRGRKSLDDAQAAAAVGQIALSHCWADLLSDAGLRAAQILVTLDDLEDRRRYLNVAATLDRLLALGAVPVVNENDTVATEEIRFGDNDRLAARIAQAGSADGVILLSDVAGLYDRDPRLDENARLIPSVNTITPDIAAMAAGTGGAMGTGGMAAKIEAARIATAAGIPLAIVSGDCDRPLDAFEQTGAGTVFAAATAAPARKAWLAGRMTSAGRIAIDAGACAALANGNSLLAAGATAIEGGFERGDVVDIAGPDGRPIARGLAEYDAASAARLIGRRSEEHAAILGYAPRSALVHRDQMVIL